MNWIYLAVITASFYALYNVFIKLASGHIYEITGAVILQIVAALLGGGLLLYLRMKNIPMEISAKGIWLSVIAGIFVGLAEIFSFIVFSRGVSASAGIPVIIGGSVLFAAIIGFIFLKDSLSISNIIGLLLIIAGIYFISRQ